jgi:hypothetical protein
MYRIEESITSPNVLTVFSKYRCILVIGVYEESHSLVFIPNISQHDFLTNITGVDNNKINGINFQNVKHAITVILFGAII